MTAGDSWDKLLAEAHEKLAGQQGQGRGGNVELGDEATPAEGEHFAGRWRGEGRMTTKVGERDVFLVWDRDGRPGFLYRHARLVLEVDAEKPQVGDEVLVLRGPTEHFTTKDGEAREIFPYVLRRRPCADPLPGEPPPIAAEPVDDQDIPF